MKRLIIGILCVAILGSCSGVGWFPEGRSTVGGSDVTITFEMPYAIQVPWDLQEGQMAVLENGVWYLYQDDVLIAEEKKG